MCRKAAKNQMLTEGHFRTNSGHYMKVKDETTCVLKKREALVSFCSMLFDKNYQLYLKHETMLDEEKAKRASLADEF